MREMAVATREVKRHHCAMRCALILKEGCHLLTHNGFHVFYNSNPITTFPCAPFSDIQALGHEFPNLYFSAIVNDLHLYFVFWSYC